MSIIEQFKRKSESLSVEYKKINSILSKLKEDFIISNLNRELGVNIVSGKNKVSLGWVEEISIDGEVFQFINRFKQKYKSYVCYIKQDYHVIGLGFKYKNDIVSPHMDFAVDTIISKYSEQELSEIITIMDEYLIKMNEDISILLSHTDVSQHEFYFRNYESGGFEGDEYFETINETIKNYKSL